MANSNLISVIIPVYNGEEFLPEAIASIRAQAYSPLEIIIIDDGSTDRTAQVVHALGDDLRYVYQPNQGQSAARNHGLALAQGEFIAFLDADDLWPAHKLVHQMAALSEANELMIVWGTTQILPYAEHHQPSSPVSAPRLTPCLGSLLCRQEVFQRVGVFDPMLRYGEDLDWLKRVHESGVLVQKMPDLALIYRLRPGSVTYGKPLHELGLISIVKSSLARRRAVDATKPIGDEPKRACAHDS